MFANRPLRREGEGEGDVCSVLVSLLMGRRGSTLENRVVMGWYQWWDGLMSERVWKWQDAVQFVECKLLEREGLAK